MRGLYAIIDLGALDARGLCPVEFAQAVVRGGAAAVQVRAKRADGRRVVDLLRSVLEVTRAGGVPLFANDRADLALIAGCDGLHVGQGDLRPAEARSLAEKGGRPIRIGLSTHDESQALAALDEPVDYVAVGPVFGTASKESPDPTLGAGRALAIAARVRAARPALPIVAIGGITPDAARRLAGAFDAVAVIGALLPESGADLASVARRAESFSSAIGRGSA